MQVHGWIYGLHNGLVRDLEYTVAYAAAQRAGYEQALAALLPVQ